MPLLKWITIIIDLLVMPIGYNGLEIVSYYKSLDHIVHIIFQAKHNLCSTKHDTYVISFEWKRYPFRLWKNF